MVDGRLRNQSVLFIIINSYEISLYRHVYMSVCVFVLFDFNYNKKLMSTWKCQINNLYLEMYTCSIRAEFSPHQLRLRCKTEVGALWNNNIISISTQPSVYVQVVCRFPFLYTFAINKKTIATWLNISQEIHHC